MQGVKRFGAYVVLALSMLLMQQGGLRHALEHSASKNDAAPTHSTLCKDCLSYCASDAIAPQAVLLALASDLIDQRVATGQTQRTYTVSAGYQSRAPPLMSFWF